MLTHANLTTNLIQCEPASGLTNIRRATEDGQQERLIGLLPLFHSYGLSCVLHQGMFLGAHTRTFRKFDQKEFLKGIRAHKV
jgi:acyl-CoA synthetase (AMP-forming)/AMP-acid ligase II